MTRPEIQVCLTEKLEAAWRAYHQKVLQLPSSRVDAMAYEIHATRTCYEELVYNAGDYPADLLALDDPLKTVREQWIRKENEHYFSNMTWHRFLGRDIGIGMASPADARCPKGFVCHHRRHHGQFPAPAGFRCIPGIIIV